MSSTPTDKTRKRAATIMDWKRQPARDISPMEAAEKIFLNLKNI